MNQKKQRWYDKYPNLSKMINDLEKLDQTKLDKILIDLKNMIIKTNPGLIDDNVLNFTMPIKRRRWYDNDPYSWLIFNALKYAEDGLLNDIMIYLEKNIY